MICFPKDENVSIVMLAGNLLHFAEGLFHLPVVDGTRILLPREAFEVDFFDEEEKQVLETLQTPWTRISSGPCLRQQIFLF